MSEVVFEHVGKVYRLGQIGSGTLQEKAAEIAASLGLTDFPDAD